MLKIIKEIFKEPFYRKITIVLIILFGWVNWWLLTRTTTFLNFFQMAWNGDFFYSFGYPLAKIFSISYAVLYWLMTAGIVVTFGVSAALIVWLYRNSSLAKLRSGGAGLGGTLAAIFASGCPICGSFLFSLIGVAGGVSIFPFKGLELKVLSLGLLVGSVAFASRRIEALSKDGSCLLCEAPAAQISSKPGFSLSQGLIWVIIAFLAVSQFTIGSILPKSAGSKISALAKISAIFTPQGESVKEIIAPLLNEDGQTTSLAKQPTITEVPAEPKGMDPLEAAKVVMIAKGTPFYAEEIGASFDDPLSAQQIWVGFLKSIQLPSDLEERYQKLVSTQVCSYCCGSPNNVATINRCGCAHSKAVQGFFKYMLQNYPDKYSNEELMGEAHRWYGVWYPKGMVEDYLLATGRVDVIGHNTHGGAGPDGMHGLGEI